MTKNWRSGCVQISETIFFQKQPSDTDTPEPPSYLPIADEISVELERNTISNEAEVNSLSKYDKADPYQRLKFLKKQDYEYTTEQKRKTKLRLQHQRQKMWIMKITPFLLI